MKRTRQANGLSALVVAMLAGALFACGTAGSLKAFKTSQIRVGAAKLVVYVADNPSLRSQGMRDVDGFEGKDGMLFQFDSESAYPFTMARVRFPLDVGFYSSHGKFLETFSMGPCEYDDDDDCPLYEPEYEFRYALETPEGELPAGNLELDT